LLRCHSLGYPSIAHFYFWTWLIGQLTARLRQ